MKPIKLVNKEENVTVIVRNGYVYDAVTGEQYPLRHKLSRNAYIFLFSEIDRLIEQLGMKECRNLTNLKAVRKRNSTREYKRIQRICNVMNADIRVNRKSPKKW